MAKSKHQPPAKIKYDSTHPTISIRVDQKLKKQLDEIKKTSGKSAGDILREAIGAQAVSTGKAFEAGERKAKDTYGVSFKCSECKGTIWINTPQYRGWVTELIEKYGWGHSDCKLKPGKIIVRNYEPPSE